MEANTLYYTLSAMPQVIGAVAAIIIAFSNLRIANLREYLIGDGRSVLDRWEAREPGYTLPKDGEKQRKRLRDALHRRIIPEIKQVIFLLSENEKNEDHPKKEKPAGLQYVYKRFLETDRHIADLKLWTLIVIAFSFFSIIASIVSLASTDAIISSAYCGLKNIVLWLNVALFAASLILSFYVLWRGLFGKTAHEFER
jgi:hypothetical protein